MKFSSFYGNVVQMFVPTSEMNQAFLLVISSFSHHFKYTKSVHSSSFYHKQYSE
ncbi:hypothetical protein Syun_004691 [Stephania yunnanensis]|uniref:Uncharacterized protein n=1 Tax=Stephania yunnanensis TaxID=152371 RepID=A0AAP0L6V1_9MAGN